MVHPNEKLFAQDLLIFLRNHKHIMSLFHSSNHHAVVEVIIKLKTITIYDGLQWGLMHWTGHISQLLTKCMLVIWEGSTIVEYVRDTAQPTLIGNSRCPRAMINGYCMIIHRNKWQLERGCFIDQTDSLNCGPIVCLKLMELYQCVDVETTNNLH